MVKLSRVALAVTAGIGAMVVMESSALAAIFCDDASISNPLIIQAGDTQEPMLRAMGRKLRNSAVTPVTVLYQTTGTCTIIGKNAGAGMFATDPTKRVIAANATLLYAPSTAENPTWDPSQAPSQCTVNPASFPTGIPIDIGIGATYASSCTTDSPPTGIGVIPGPIAGYGFIVPKASSQVSLTAEQGYFVFGFGDNSMALPWIDDHFMFTRLSTKSTELTTAAAVGVSPVTKMKGTPFNGSPEVLNSVAQSTNPEKTIGLMGTEIYDVNRDKVTLLAFRAFGQRYAFLPDSSPTSFDKKNLRDGHYMPWAQTVYMTPVDNANIPSIPNAKLFIDLVLGNQKLADVDGLATIISVGQVPLCSMGVTRDPADAAPLRKYTPATPCSCFFEAKVPNGKTSCSACTIDADCGDGGTMKCRNNYCEAH